MGPIEFLARPMFGAIRVGLLSFVIAVVATLADLVNLDLHLLVDSYGTHTHQGQGVAGPAPALPPAVHADRLLVAEPGWGAGSETCELTMGVEVAGPASMICRRFPMS